MERIKKSSYEFTERLDDLSGFEKTKTQQQFAQEVDINTIVARAVKTGMLGDPMSINARQAIFGDFSEVGSYHACLNRVMAAQGAFMQLPADLRASFDNDPGKLMEFMGNPANKDKAIELGLIVKPEKPAPAPLGPEVTPPPVVPPAK